MCLTLKSRVLERQHKQTFLFKYLSLLCERPEQIKRCFMETRDVICPSWVGRNLLLLPGLDLGSWGGWLTVC